LNEQIYGIDIHPLSVQIAKTTLLLALGKEIINAKKPVYLNIILAKTLLAPEGVQNLFGNEFILNIDKENYHLTTQILDDVKLFDEALGVCDDLAEQTLGKRKESEEVFENIFRKHFANNGNKSGANKQVIESFYKIYTGLKAVKDKGRDSIWKFIVQNLYKPYFLAGKFDYIIGNPPWFTYSSIRNEDYQSILNTLADKYDVKPDEVKNFTNLEIAAIFLSYCSSYFLKDNSHLAFVLPRSFFSADHHNNSRTGKSKGYRIVNLWDLKDVKPLFRVPSCVFFVQKADKQRRISSKGLSGRTFIGNLNTHNCKLADAKELVEVEVNWYLRKQGKSTAFSNKKSGSSKEGNPYKKLFKRGAEITPRNFYFIELTQEFPSDWDDRIINIQTSASSKKEAKKPWNLVDINGKIESQFLFRTALAKSILPFALLKPDLIVLPMLVNKTEAGTKDIKLFTADELREEGFLNASKWFQNAERFWEVYKTAANKELTAIDYLNYHNKLLS